MFRHYHHGHSLLVGALIGLLLDRYMFIVACIAFAVGMVAGRAWGWSSLVSHALRDKWHLSKSTKRSPRPTPVYKASAQSDRVPW